MKRSTQVQLVLLGSAIGLYGCEQTPQTVRQHQYASLEDCKRDWGDPRECSQGGYGGSGGGGYYLGPRYYWDSNNNRPRSIQSDGSEHEITTGRVATTGISGGEAHVVGSVSRGGFGGFGHGFGGGE
jgi:hypothetical protein